MGSLLPIITLYIIGILVGKRQGKISSGSILVLVILAILQTCIIMIDMIFRKPPAQ